MRKDTATIIVTGALGICLAGYSPLQAALRDGFSGEKSLSAATTWGSSEGIAQGALLLAASGGASKEGGKKGEGDKKGEGGKNLYEINSMIVNLADPGGRRYLRVTLKMEMSQPKLQEELTERDHEIKDALIVILSSKEYDDISSLPGKTRLKQEILARLNKILKTGQLTEVYLADFIIQ